jgi:hypothetical protein
MREQQEKMKTTKTIFGPYIETEQDKKLKQQKKQKQVKRELEDQISKHLQIKQSQVQQDLDYDFKE